MGVEDNIDSFLEKYWKLPFKASFADMTEGWDWPLEELRKKYGDETMNRYNELVSALFQADDAMHSCPEGMDIHQATFRRIGQDLYAFVFETGLCDEIPRSTVVRGRETLKSLLGILSKVDKPFTMVDLGSGDGKIATGLALYLDNLQKLYTVDELPAALRRMHTNIDKLEDKERALGKIFSIEGNYLSEDVQTKFQSYEPQKADIVLAAYQSASPEIILPQTAAFAKPDGRILACFTQRSSHWGISPFESQAMVKAVTENAGNIAFNLNFEFSLLDSAVYAIQDMLLIGEFKKINASGVEKSKEPQGE